MGKLSPPAEKQPTTEIIVPFLKWAGGKRWLVKRLPELLPGSYQRYVEPFLGSGAIFFALQPKQAVLADANPQLIQTYKALRRDWKAVVKALNMRARRHSDDFYYEERDSSYDRQVDRAAQFIYLNRTCWNGLYRVNKRGEFNVPRGTKDAVLLDTDDFAAVAKALRNADLRCSDFESIVDEAARGDLLFVDPPYTVHHKFNGFLKYNEQLFSWADQERLAAALRRAEKRGCKIILTNADHESVRALYRGFGKHSTFTRASIISGDASARRPFTELVVVA